MKERPKAFATLTLCRYDLNNRPECLLWVVEKCPLCGCEHTHGAQLSLYSREKTYRAIYKELLNYDTKPSLGNRAPHCLPCVNGNGKACRRPKHNGWKNPCGQPPGRGARPCIGEDMEMGYDLFDINPGNSDALLKELKEEIEGLLKKQKQ